MSVLTDERLLTARELADALGFAAGTILDWFENGDLPGFKFGNGPRGAVRFRESEVLAWLEARRCAPGPDSERPSSQSPTAVV